MDKAPYAIIHVPHSSRFVPEEYRSQFILTDAELEQEMLKITDAYVDEIVGTEIPLGTVITFPASRLLVDPERFLDDGEEPMADVGMGAIYTRCADGRPLRHGPDNLVREELIRKYYVPHHLTVSAAVAAALEEYQCCLILDCHSFPSSPLRCEQDQSPNRPDICIGTDPFHTPEWLTDALFEAVGRCGLSLEINRPFSGTFVPGDYYRKRSAVYSIMLEINRSLYMDEKTGRKKEGFGKFADEIRWILNEAIMTESDFFEKLVNEGVVIAYQDWDSGGPGAGAGQVSVCKFEGAFYILHDAGYSGPYEDEKAAIADSGITTVNDATREKVFLDGES